VADEFGIVLIADEVQSAFGRTGNWFGRDYYDYEPDVILLAKGLTSGYLPFSAAVFRSELAKRFVNVPFPHGVTYSGHPVSCAAALATIDVIDQDGLIERAAEMGTRLDTALRELFERHLSIGDLRTIGLFAAVEFVRNRDTREPIGANVAVEGATSGTDVAAQVTAAMRRRGVIVSSSRVNGIIKMAPPLTVEPHEIDTTIAALDEVLTLLDRQIDES
jgi:taurine--2-oxoglutarate transaminase